MSSNKSFSTETSERYALALFELSKENSELDKIEDEMKSFGQLLRESSDFREMIFGKNQVELISCFQESFLFCFSDISLREPPK